MTGRLDQVDLDTDLILIVLSRSDEEGLPLNDLHTQIEAVDVDPFVFDEAFSDGTNEFIRCCRMFKKINLIEKEDSRVRLTERGELMADILEESLTDEQGQALHHAGVIR